MRILALCNTIYRPEAWYCFVSIRHLDAAIKVHVGPL